MGRRTGGGSRNQKRRVPRAVQRVLWDHLPGECSRGWDDHLVVSSAIFFAAAIVSAFAGQRVVAVLQIGSFLASTAYHKVRESAHLTVDALLSSTLMFISLWCVYEAYWVCPPFFWLGAAGFPAAGFLMVYCGMPGGPRYHGWHCAWHYVSGVGTALTALFLRQFYPDFDERVAAWVGHYAPLDELLWHPV